MESSPNNPIDTSICPLCGEPNHCAMAADPNAKECWCSGEKFPRALLEKVPAEAIRRACICPTCLEQSLNNEESTERS